MTTDELIEYYKGQLIIQYRELDKARGTIGAFVQEVIADQIYRDVLNGFNLNDANGVQLNLLGSYRGAQRYNYGLTLNRDFFQLADAGDSDVTVQGLFGFADVSQADDTILHYFRGQTVESEAAPVYALTDDELRKLIRFKIAVHFSKLSLKDIDTILTQFFSTRVRIEESGVMQIAYHYQLSDTDNFFYIVRTTNSLPRPAGSVVSYVGF